ENSELLEAIGRAGEHLPTGICWVLDRGGDRQRLFEPLISAGRHFIIRLQRDRRLRYQNHTGPVEKLATRMERPWSTATWVAGKNGRRTQRTYKGGAWPVELP